MTDVRLCLTARHNAWHGGTALQAEAIQDRAQEAREREEAPVHCESRTGGAGK